MLKTSINVKLKGQLELPEVDNLEEIEVLLEAKKKRVAISIHAEVDDYLLFKTEATRHNMSLGHFMIFCAKTVSENLQKKRDAANNATQ